MMRLYNFATFKAQAVSDTRTRATDLAVCYSLFVSHSSPATNICVTSRRSMLINSNLFE